MPLPYRIIQQAALLAFCINPTQQPFKLVYILAVSCFLEQWKTLGTDSWGPGIKTGEQLSPSPMMLKYFTIYWACLPQSRNPVVPLRKPYILSCWKHFLTLFVTVFRPKCHPCGADILLKRKPVKGQSYNAGIA